MAGFDLTSLVTEAFGVASQQADVATASLATAARLSDAAEAKAVAARKTAEAEAEVVRIKLTDTARQENERKAIAARMGTDPTVAGSVIEANFKKIQEANKGQLAAAERIRAKDSITLLDNPLGYLVAQATINEDIADHNFYVRARGIAQQEAKDAAGMTTDLFLHSNALTSVNSQAFIDASTIIAAHKGNVEAADAAIQGLRWNMEGITLAAGANRDRLQTLFSANSAIMQDKQFRLGLENHRMAVERFNLDMQIKQDKVDEESYILRTIQQGFTNLTGETNLRIPAKEAVMMYKANRPDIMQFFKSGLETSMLGGKPVVSLSPYTVSDLTAEGKVRRLPESQMQVATKLVELRRNFENQAVQAALQLDPKDKNAKEKAFNKYVDEQRTMELANMRPDSVFAPADLKLVAGQNKTVANLPVWKNVLGPAAVTGVNINDPNIAVGLVLGALRNKQLSYVDAVDFSTVIAAGLDNNNQSRNFISMGLPAVRTYNTRVTLPGQLGKTTVNLADAQQFARALNKAEAAIAAQQSVGRGGMFTGE